MDGICYICKSTKINKQFTMVNTEEFTKRLSRIMEFYDLSAASFADRIDVGRSSISHLLSGRNKPSLDFVLKIVSAFPEVELYWLLNGKGSFPHSGKGAVSSLDPPTPMASLGKQPDLFSEAGTEPQERISAGNRAIHKIVIFYSDGSFEAFQN